jgi:hypothetical protein
MPFVEFAQPQPAVQATAVLIGQLAWISNNVKFGCRAIAIKRPDETASGDPLRGINLTKSASEKLDKLVGETIFHFDKVKITVRTENLTTDLESGKGLKGQTYFVGEDINRM